MAKKHSFHLDVWEAVFFSVRGTLRVVMVGTNEGEVG